MSLLSHCVLKVCCGNAGTAGTAQQWRGLERSLIRQKTGNMGTQLCLINSQPAPACSRKKTEGTSDTSESPVLERSCPSPRVPSESEFRRGNKGGYELFLLTELLALVPHVSKHPKTARCRRRAHTLAGIGHLHPLENPT